MSFFGFGSGQKRVKVIDDAITVLLQKTYVEGVTNELRRDILKQLKKRELVIKRHFDLQFLTENKERQYIERLTTPIHRHLREFGIKAIVLGRIKLSVGQVKAFARCARNFDCLETVRFLTDAFKGSSNIRISALMELLELKAKVTLPDDALPKIDWDRCRCVLVHYGSFRNEGSFFTAMRNISNSSLNSYFYNQTSRAITRDVFSIHPELNAEFMEELPNIMNFVVRKKLIFQSLRTCNCGTCKRYRIEEITADTLI